MIATTHSSAAPQFVISKRRLERIRFPDRIKERSTTLKWGIPTAPVGFQDVAITLDENGVVYSDILVESNGLQYFEVAVKELHEVHLGVGLFQTKARIQGPPHLNIKHCKVWWSDGVFQSFKTTYGTRHSREAKEGFSAGDVIGCGIRSDMRAVFLTRNGAWLGDYTFDSKSETRLAVFLHTDGYNDSLSLSLPWFDIRISFDESHSPFAAQAYLARMVSARTRQFVEHAPLPPEVLSIIVHYVISGSSRTAQRLVGRLRLVCRHWSGILRPIPFATISISKIGHLESLMKTVRTCPADTSGSNPGQYIRTFSIGSPWKCNDVGPPAVETVLLLGLGTHATQLTQLTYPTQTSQLSLKRQRYRSDPPPVLPLPAPPRVTSRLPALLRHLRTLHTLELTHRFLHSCAQLFSIIHALPSLKNLVLDYVTIDRVGPVRPAHVAAAAQRLQTFSWKAVPTINQRAAMAAVAARLCTGNDSGASAVAEAVLRAPWTTNWSSTIWAEYTYKADTSGTPDSSLNVRHVFWNLNLKWSIPSAGENSPIRARLLATFRSSYGFSSVELALQDLDSPRLCPHYPLTLTLNDTYLETKVPDLQARLPELMPHAHRLGLITIEAGTSDQE
ncbi:SPRY-domain-containing protein [Phanerochaete sordida]|uniref:SPRY-domain-containing protein n=1 Tax=Phanerochaete sordida TaxID=48140 RepID=A0A9P3GNP9_9APHY|nr:SPRY-domain-containing protein [Phanerochaete sordida]